MRISRFSGLFLAIVVILYAFSSALAYGESIAKHLQDISVTIKAENSYGSGSQGSGVIITRELKVKPDSEETIKVNFIWSAAHVIFKLRNTREIVDNGQKKTVVEFKDAAIVQELIENGRRVGEVKMDAKVIKYSNADTGEDLCLLMIRKQNFIDVNAEFRLSDEIIPVGEPLFHVGSLLGQMGANSLTDGVLSQVGRVIQTDTSTAKEFDQGNFNSFPGSSGGGVYTKSDGKYVGMLVRGAGESFSLFVPIRRIKAWVKSVDMEWTIDPSKPAPALSELKDISVEDTGTTFEKRLFDDDTNTYKPNKYNFMILEFETYEAYRMPRNIIIPQYKDSESFIGPSPA